MTTDLLNVELLDDAPARQPLTADALRAPMHTLAKARQAKAMADELVRTQRTAWEQRNVELLTRQKEATAALALAEAETRAVTAMVYADTKEKKPIIGAEIKLYDVITVANEDDAFAWARKTGLAIIPEKLDVDALVKIASVQKLPFMAYAEEPRVALSTKLDPAAYAVVVDMVATSAETD